MVGITSYGAYIPRYRLNRKTIFSAMGWLNSATAGVARGEKAVANYDEDGITMAVAAARDCLTGCDRDGIDGLYLGSTTVPYLERQNAAICAAALALRPDIRTADFGASLKSGSSAIISACDAVRLEGVKNFLVCATDSRHGKTGSSMEHTFGDGAAAFTLGKDDVIAELKGSHSISRDFIDNRRMQGERFINAWEARWIRDEGYVKIISEAVAGFLEKYSMKIGDFNRVVIGCPVGGALKELSKKLGVEADRLQDNLVGNVGDTGSALAPMMLVAALEEAKPGDKILVAGYGNGCDILFFEVTSQIETARDRMGIKGHLSQKAALENYAKYLVLHDLVPVDIGIRGEETPIKRMSMIYREGEGISALCGSKCKACGTPQYPKQRVCVNPECGAIDQMEDYPFHDLIGRIVSYTGDNLAFSMDPPAIYGLIDFDEGGRLYLDITDCDLDSLHVGLPVRMSFRRKHVDKGRGICTYFWKAVPILEKGA